MRIVGFVYMLKCRDNSYYIGSHRGEDVLARVGEYNAGAYKQAYTFTRCPVELVWNEAFYRYDEMVACERQLKGWSRKKKEALIKGDSKLLALLSKRGFRPAQDAHPSRCDFVAPQDEGGVALHDEVGISGLKQKC